MEKKDLSLSIGKKTVIRITDKHGLYTPEEADSIYAINWFNLNSSLVYNFYNLLALKSVLKAGAKPYFKAKVGSSLYGDEKLKRSLLLIVKYPQPQSFLRLLSGKYFQAISLFRNISVREFSFGFASKTRPTKWKKNTDSYFYFLHIYRSTNNLNDRYTQLLSEAIENQQIEVFFEGIITKDLTIDRKGKESKKIPCLMDGLIIYRATDKKLLLESLLNENYREEANLHAEQSLIVELSRVL